MAKTFFTPIYIGGNVTFYDWIDKDSHPASREECNAILHAEFESQLAEVSKSSVSIPGCHRMWSGPDTQAFLAQLNSPDGFKHLSAYRKSLRPQRLADGLDGTSRTLLAWRGVQPLGGVVLYNDKILAVLDGVISFVSHIGPFTSQAVLSSDLMNYLLENTLDAIDKDGSVLRVQLDEWQFPEAKQNRWRDDLANFIQWHGLLNRHDSVYGYDRVDGVRYRVTYRLTSS